jgi:DNA-binding NarL/FixJ family response regulator
MLAEALTTALEVRGYRVLAMTTTVADGVAAVATCEPDVCLIGLLFAERTAGLEAARAIAQRYPATRVALLSGIDDPEILSQVARSGVAGFIRKNQSIDQIAAALDVIAAGGNVLNLGSLLAPARGTVGPRRLRNALAELSPREKEIAARIAGGQSTRQMSFAMDITVGTVRTYVKNVLAKLGVHSRLQLAALASQDGLLIDHAALENAIAPRAS